MKNTSLLRLITLALALGAAPLAHSQTTAFTYQGKLVDDCCPATGLYDLTFKVFDGASPGMTGQQGPTVALAAVPVTNGLFTVSLDFGSAPFMGARRWLQIDARTNNALASYATLLPRTELTPTPYALHAQKAATVADNAITAANIAAGQVVKSLNGLTDAVSLVAGANVTFTPNGNNLTINSSGSGAFSLNGNNAYYNAGNVGIGTASPGANLEIRTAEEGIRLQGSGQAVVTFNKLIATPFGQLSQRIGYVGDASSGDEDIYLTATSGNVQLNAGGQTVLTATPDYRVGIGTSTPGGKLHVHGNEAPGASIPASATVLASGDGFNNRFMSVNGNQAVYLSMWHGGYGELSTYDYATGIGLPLRLNANGGTVSVPVLEIRGGSDLAEPFPMSGKDVPKGSVVVIDEEKLGTLKLSDRAYDTRVAGIISGANGVNPGISLHQEGVLEGGQNVALTGKVYALADASDAPIKPGDLLTTSATPGHCMKVSDSTKAQGAIIGKAMSALAGGKGMVLVLVSLQ